ncbi:MAG: hypothetical protein KIPDCIKN_03128 [Haliscomenobacter sp.]|jgi:outer membrane protein|nr:hypothetical protein [Haliscomenobacter sp.]
MHVRAFHGLAFALILGFCPALQGQSSDLLTAYIQEAFQNSPKLRQSAIAFERQKLALEASRRMFLPDAAFGTTYTLAEGGRTIEFPVGDLMNPVYSTLNVLTQSNSFPQIENVNEQLLPSNFYDARFRIRQPILNAEIEVNKKIQGGQLELKAIEAQILKRELAKEVKVAYFRYLQAAELVEIYKRNKDLLLEQKRVNESLLRNEKLIPSILDRNQAEVAKLESQLIQAQVNVQNAALLFNYLLNRDPAAAIAVDSSFRLASESPEQRSFPREELAQLGEVRQLNQWLIELEEAKRKPSLGAQLDLGSQNFDFKWGGYAMLGLSLEVPVWNAGRQKLKVQQARLAASLVEEDYVQLQQAIQLESALARNAFTAEQANWESYNTQLVSARKFYQDTFRRYKEGVANFLELLDAQTQLTTVEAQQTISRYTLLIRQAELERALAAFSLENPSK